MKRLVLFDPKTARCEGMNASISNLALPLTTPTLLQNLRIGTGIPTVRDGCALRAQDTTNKMKNGWTVSAAVLHMMDSGTSTPTLFVAVDDGTAIDVYWSTDFSRTDGSNVNFFKLTASSGQWGDTRLATGTQEVAFSVVKSPTRLGVSPFDTYTAMDKDLVLFSDGSKVCVSPLTAGDARQIRESWRSANLGVFRQEATFPVYYTMTDAGVNLTGDTHITVSDTGTVPTTSGIAPKISFLTTITGTSEVAKVAKASGSSKLAQSQELNIVFYCSDLQIFNYVAVGLYNGSTNTEIWVPGTSTYRLRYTIVDAGKGIWMVTFNIDQNLVASTTNITEVRLRWANSTAPSANTDLYLLGIMGGGTKGGGTSYAVSYYASGPFTESEAVNCDDGSAAGGSLANVGVGDPKHHFTIPVVPYVKYVYNLQYEFPPQSPTDKTGWGSGLDTLLVYCRDYGAQNYWLCDSAVLATYSGSWAVSGGHTAGETVTYQTSTTVEYPRRAPAEFHRPIPPHTCAVSANNRLFVGSPKYAPTVSGNTVVNRSGYMFSRLGDCFAMSDNFDLVDPLTGAMDQTAAGRAELNGHRPVALAVATEARSSLQVTDPLVIVSDRGVYTADTREVNSLLKPSLVSQHGSKCPGGVCVGRGGVYWFSSSRQLWRIGQTLDSPSRWRVDRLWNGIPTNSATGLSTIRPKPRDAKVSLAFVDDKVHVAYTPTGFTMNVAVSIYDTLLDVWYDDAFAGSLNAERLFRVNVTDDKDQLLFLNAGFADSAVSAINPKLYQYEKPGTDGDVGTQVTVSWQFPFIMDPEWLAHVYNQVGIICDGVTSSATISVARTALPTQGAATTTSSIVLSTQTTYTYRWDTDVNDNTRVGIGDSAFRVGLSGTLPAGFRFYSVVLQTEEGGTDIRDSRLGQNG